MLDNIHLTPNHITYVAIGSAANVIAKRVKNLPDKDLHQFPNFMKQWLEEFPELILNLVLIDPALSDPPYCVSSSKDNYDKHGDKLVNEWLNVCVYPIRSPINIFKDREVFVNLNKRCMENNSALLVHDFSGNRIDLLAYSFDHELKNHMDQIVYDIDLRNNQGCFINMENCFVPIKKTPNGFKFLNLASYNGEQVNQFLKDYTIGEHIKQKLYQTRLASFKDVFGVFRRFYMYYKTNSVNVEGFDNICRTMCNSQFSLIEAKYGECYHFFEEYKSGNTQSLEQLLIFLEMAVNHEVDDIMAMMGLEKGYFSTFPEPDPYKWYNNFSSLCTEKLN